MFQRNATTLSVVALLIALGIFGSLSGLLQHLQTGIRRITTSPQAEKAETFEQVQDIPEGIFYYGGSTTWANIRDVVDKEIKDVWTNFKLVYSHPPNKPPGSGTGIKMLLNDELAFSQSSRSVKLEEYKEADQRGFALKQVPVAIDAIVIVVNHGLNIRGLTLSQLKGIYTGKITNWSQVQGPNLPIIPYSRNRKAGGTVSFFVDNILGAEEAEKVKLEFDETVTLVDNTTIALGNVGDNLGGIYYASAAQIIRQCTVQIKPLPIGQSIDDLVPPYEEPFRSNPECLEQPNRLNRQNVEFLKYPITRRLYVIIKEKSLSNQKLLDQQAGEAYAQLLLTRQGQELIYEAGFVPLKSVKDSTTDTN